MGQLKGFVWMQEVHTTSNVTISNSNLNSGGLIGIVDIGATACVVNSYSNAVLTGGSCAGGIFGESCSSITISFSENNFMLQLFHIVLNSSLLC